VEEDKMADVRDEAVGKPFTQRDELAFSIFEAILTGRFTREGLGYYDDDAVKKSLAQTAYEFTDAFLAYRRDR
jgi:hypothetical protein